jgi:hypothetical protein
MLLFYVLLYLDLYNTQQEETPAENRQFQRKYE